MRHVRQKVRGRTVIRAVRLAGVDAGLAETGDAAGGGYRFGVTLLEAVSGTEEEGFGTEKIYFGERE